MNYQNIVSGLVFLLFVFSGCTNTGKIQINKTDQEISASVSEKDDNSSARYEQVSQALASEKGCLSCHEGIEDINEAMMPYLIGYGGGKKGTSCAVCHEGNPAATTKNGAHKGLLPDPGNMWVVSKGKGCGKCHSQKHALTSIMAQPLPEPVGGALMESISFATDPSGKTGSNHVYRLQRALVSLEYGKVSHTLSSNGIVPKNEYTFCNFDMDDPDGAVPDAGTEKYKAWIRKAIESGYIQRKSFARGLPDFKEALKLWNDPEKAAFADYYRKECGRCHVWMEGRRERGDIRGGGCTSCHVLYTNDGYYEGSDTTIPKNKKYHPYKHEITTKIPASQCAHCHTRGKRIGTTFAGIFEYDYKSNHKATPLNEKGEYQEPLYTKDYLHIRGDIHFEKGVECIDCHTSIDVHGDGNIYPTTLYQVEIQCYDCHGTPDKYPWELPVGYGTPVILDGGRGVYETDKKEYLLTSRGNPRRNLVKEGDGVTLISFYSGKEHAVPLLKTINAQNTWKTKAGMVAMSTVSQHIEKLECYACHSLWAPQCYGCHIKHDRRGNDTDWLLSAKNHDPMTGQQRLMVSSGKNEENRSFMRWEEPMLGVNLKGKVSPVVPGCQVVFTYVDEEGKVRVYNKINKTMDGFNAPTLAPLQPHSNTVPARTCESCHVNPKAIGYGTANSRSQKALQQDEPVFVNMGKGFFGDIPGSQSSRWQIPAIPLFPYTFDQLITRSGNQVQNMPRIQDRPLNTNERDKTEREGICIACHKNYNTPLWTEIKEKYGSALTPEDHDRIVESALKAMVK